MGVTRSCTSKIVRHQDLGPLAPKSGLQQVQTRKPSGTFGLANPKYKNAYCLHLLIPHHEKAAMSLLHLPNELVLQISQNLNPVDLYAFLRANRALFHLLYDSLLGTACDKSQGCCGEYENRSRNLLYSAAQRGDKELVKLVVSKGILKVVDPAKLLVRLLRRRKCNDALRILLECGVYPMKEQVSMRELPLRYAVTHGKAKALEIMLDTSDVDVNRCLYEGVTLLYLAVEHRQMASIQVLLARKEIDVNESSLADDCTPLYHAVRSVDRSEDITRVLLADPRVDVNCSDADIQTPLHAVLPGRRAIGPHPAPGCLRKPAPRRGRERSVPGVTLAPRRREIRRQLHRRVRGHAFAHGHPEGRQGGPRALVALQGERGC
ncbi:hypothetical protein HOY82DRAFT_126437 [Tuber indicum]|nr:hypothetical protein HOY82DRAFT_126437 [Tuber indicum]